MSKIIKLERKEMDAKRRALVDRTNELLREIELHFNTVAYWNNQRRKPGEAEIDPDPDGQMRKCATACAETLCRESVHKIPRAQWLSEIRRVAIEKWGFTENGASKTDWEQFAHDYYLDCTPEEALREDASNA